MGKLKRLPRERAHKRRTVGRYRRPAELRLDLPQRSVTAVELEQWERYANHIGLGDHRKGYSAVVIPNYEDADDQLLAQLYTRAKLRLRRARLCEDGAALWFELHGPGGWVRVGRRVQMPIDAECEPV